MSNGQNQQTVDEIRRFLTENRQSMVTLFKRHAKIGSAQTDIPEELDELVKQLVLLITVTDFLAVSAVAPVFDLD